MTRPGREGDLLIEPPFVRRAEVVPTREDRSYVVFIGGAMFSAIVGGFALAIVVSLAGSGLFWQERLPWLIQAHGWAQLQGWAGLFVAGMGLRLLPRFSGHRPLAKRVNFAVFIPLFAGTVLRTVAQPFSGDGISPAVFFAAQVLWACGAAAFSGMVLRTLVRAHGRDPWRVFALGGACWWLAWAVASVAAGVRGARNDAFVPNALDEPMTWMVMLGAIGNFIWAVQSRAVPIFFGRKPPPLSRVVAPGILLNAGVALVFAAGWFAREAIHERLLGVGFVLCGSALVWLAPTAGSCWGKATRLRPRARSAARFVLLANLSAITCGLLLLWVGTRTLMAGEFAAVAARDAARHAFGVGVITLLVVGMAQLIAPFFALRRVEPRKHWLVDEGVFWLLATAVVLRISSGLLSEHLSINARMHLSALAGSLAWVALVIFAVVAIRAIRAEPATKATIAAMATRQDPKH